MITIHVSKTIWKIPSVAEQLVTSKKKCKPRSLLVFHVLRRNPLIVQSWNKFMQFKN